MIRTSKTYTSDAFLSLFGPMDLEDGGKWTNWCAIEKWNATDTLNSNWAFKAMPPPLPEVGGFAEVVPAACSVQVLNPASLTNASGVVYMGRCATGLSQPESTDTRTAAQFCDALVSFSNPKVISGARLSMSPQQVNLVPANMNELMDFNELTVGTETAATWGPGNDFAGFKPAYVYNPNKITLQIRVCIEWRVRLSPFNPMHNAQQTYKPTSADTWHQIISTADSLGHGVEDVGIAGAAGYIMSGGVGEGFLAEAGSFLAGAAEAALPALEYAAPLLLM